MEVIIRCIECDTILDDDMMTDGRCYVDLCPTCKRRIQEDAYAEGYDAGYENGVKDEKIGK